jgi:formylglycine-generating enzyme required for sulfatase activity
VVVEDLGSGWEQIAGHAYDAGSGWHWLAEAERWVWVADPVDGESDMVLVRAGRLETINSLDRTWVDAFSIAKTEVTWEQWQEVQAWGEENGFEWSGPDGSGWGDYPDGCGADHPVQAVSWYDAVKWCNAKSEMEGLEPVYTEDGLTFKSGEPDAAETVEQDTSLNGYRLPTEAEWEFAARGGNESNGYKYAGSDNLDEVGWYRDNSGSSPCDWVGGTLPVAQKLANELGLYDMSGNVTEWVWDIAPERPANRSLRGGSSDDSDWLSEVWTAQHWKPDGRERTIGFRVVRSLVTK